MMSNCHSHAGHSQDGKDDGADTDDCDGGGIDNDQKNSPDGKDDVDGAIDKMDVAEDSQRRSSRIFGN
jgi:hypothetical protein